MLGAIAGAAALAILVAALEGSLPAMPFTGNFNNGALVDRTNKADRMPARSDASSTLPARPVSVPKLPSECMAASEWHTNIFSAEVAGRCVV